MTEQDAVSAATGKAGGEIDQFVCLHRRRAAAALLLFILAIMAVVALTMPSSSRLAGSLIVLALGSIAATWLLRAAVSKSPVLIVNRLGVTIPALTHGELSWKEIHRVQAKEGLWTPFIRFDIHEPERFEPPPWQLLRRVLSVAMGPAYYVRIFLLTANSAEILAAIEHFRAQASSSGPSSSGR